MGKQWKKCQTLFLGGSKITADGDYSHEIKRHLLHGRKVMTNLDSIFKSRDITLPTKARLVKAMVFQWSCVDVHKGGVICISEVIDISPGSLDSSLCFLPAQRFS